MKAWLNPFSKSVLENNQHQETHLLSSYYRRIPIEMQGICNYWRTNPTMVQWICYCKWFATNWRRYHEKIYSCSLSHSRSSGLRMRRCAHRKKSGWKTHSGCQFQCDEGIYAGSGRRRHPRRFLDSRRHRAPWVFPYSRSDEDPAQCQTPHRPWSGNGTVGPENRGNIRKSQFDRCRGL